MKEPCAMKQTLESILESYNGGIDAASPNRVMESCNGTNGGIHAARIVRWNESWNERQNPAMESTVELTLGSHDGTRWIPPWNHAME